MKRVLPLFALGLSLLSYAKNEVYETPGSGTVYTFAALSEIAESGVTKTDANTYSLTKDINIVAADGLKLDNNVTLNLAKDVLVRIYGSGDFAVADTATIQPLVAGDKPKGFHFTEMNAPVKMQHVRAIGASFSFFGPAGVTVDNCSFIESNGNFVKSAVFFSGSSIGNVVRNCYFNKTTYSAVGIGANIAVGLTVEGNLIEACSTEGRNYPYLNLIPAGNNGETIVRNNTMRGACGTMAGGLSVANLMGIIGENKVTVENNYIDNCRYGMQIYGYQTATVKGNKIVDCRYETNANNGGSGITIYAGGDKYPAVSHVEGNYISGCLWGVTIVGVPDVNLGNISVDASDPDYNPGNNIIKNNGNCGTAPTGSNTAFDASIPYDLYNNTAKTVYAQCNTWGGADQSDAEVEKRIFHQADDNTLGQVIFSPAGHTTGLDVTIDDKVTVIPNGDGSFTVEGVDPDTNIDVYTVGGIKIYSGKASQTIRTNYSGPAIVIVGYNASRIVL